MKTTLHYYSFDISKPGEKAAYTELLENTLTKIGFPAWTMDLRHGETYRADWQFMDKIRKSAGEIELETEHLFANQWDAAVTDGGNTNGLRLFNWAECEYPSRAIREGYWLEQTAEMREILRSTHKCGYCGKQEPAQNDHVFCSHCLGSAYLTEDDLHLTRMRPVDATGDRAKLTEAERAHLLPIYQEAQLHGQGARSIAAAKAARERIAAKYKTALRKAEAEYQGFTWLLDKGLQVDNVIYYSHAGRFCFGWREGVSESVVSAILDVISEFPSPYDIKCADGRTLSGE